jgi:hypothetical protein
MNNPYLAKLRNQEKCHPQEPSKPSKPLPAVVPSPATTKTIGFEGFEGDQGRCFSENEGLVSGAVSGTPVGQRGSAVSKESPFGGNEHLREPNGYGVPAVEETLDAPDFSSDLSIPDSPHRCDDCGQLGTAADPLHGWDWPDRPDGIRLHPRCEVPWTEKKREAEGKPFGRVFEALESRCPDVPVDRWQAAVEDGRAFLSRWGDQAEALGWTPRDLFGLHTVPDKPHPSYSRLSRYDETGLIWLLGGREVVALTEATAAIQSSTGAITTYRRHNKPALAPPGDSLDDLEAPFGGSAA